MGFRTIAATFIFIAFHLFFAGCENREDTTPKKELLIYCGITMIKPVSEIAGIIEKEEDCTVIITKGGSGNLLKSIKINNVGDLFLPGAESYIRTCLKEGLVSETVHVGYNKASLMVQKGNPKTIGSDLDNLLNPEYYVIIGNPESGSIGKETEKILKKKGIFEEVWLWPPHRISARSCGHAIAAGGGPSHQSAGDYSHS